MSARCGCAVNAPEADPALYPCPCGDHCAECKPRTRLTILAETERPTRYDRIAGRPVFGAGVVKIAGQRIAYWIGRAYGAPAYTFDGETWHGSKSTAYYEATR